MSKTRVITLCIAVAMSTLVGHSSVAYATGKEPPIFFGPAFPVLLGAWLVCLTVWLIAVRVDRQAVREQAEDLRLAVVVAEWEITQSEID